MPAENEIGRRSPKTPRKRRTSCIASTCSGGPDRYITRSLAGKKSRWFSTISVLENFTPSPRPSERARPSSRSMNAVACAQVASFSNAASGMRSSV